MPNLTLGMCHLKKRIHVKAPVEICYQTWLDSPHLTDVMKRVLGFRSRKNHDVTPITVTEKIQDAVQSLKQDIVSEATIKHWLLSGPGGKLYEVESTIILEIPNLFYCSTSIDPDDLSVQNSVLFSPDAMNQTTLVEWQISFWDSAQKGSLTQLLSDIMKSGDCFLEDCLQDFKTYIENGQFSASST